DIPDCGGSCLPCLETEKPLKNNINYAFFIIIFILISLLIATGKISYPYFLSYLKKRKKKYYEEKLILEASVSESIFDSIRKIEELIEKEDKEKLILLLSQVIRRYFKTLFNLRYEFTYEELIKEINSRKVSQTFKNVFINFFEKSTEIEFSGKSISKEEFKAFLSEFKQIVLLTSSLEKQREEAEKNNTEIYKEKTTKEDKINLKDIYNKINSAENLLIQKNINEAYFLYLRIINDYKLLDYDEKKKIYGFIERLYQEIKLAREEFEKNDN
ncbi:MAG: hypothetical protein QXR96_01985, partial [Candidatus Woesearchaeota archaeon]